MLETLKALAVTLNLLLVAIASIPPTQYNISPYGVPGQSQKDELTLDTTIAQNRPIFYPTPPKSPFYLPDEPTQGQIRTYIAKTAGTYGVNQVLSLAIAKCESRFNPRAKNPKSSASGIFQIIKSTWEETMLRMELPTSTDVFDPEINIEAAMFLLSQDGGVNHWESSRACWQPEL